MPAELPKFNWLIISTVSFAVGIFVANFWLPSLSILGFVLLIVVIIIVVSLREPKTIYARWLVFLAVLLLGMVAGMARFGQVAESWQEPLNDLVGERVEFVGVVSEMPDKRESNQRLVIVTDKAKIIVSTERYQDIAYGDEVRVSGQLRKPEAFATAWGRTFDYHGYLKAKGIAYQMSFAQVEVIGEEKGNPILSFLYSGKQKFMTALEKVMAEPYAALGEGLLLGVKQALGTDLENDFRRTGIIHIVVLSGYNVMLVVMFMMWILGLVLPYRLRIFGGLLGIVTFALIVGLSATVLRASVMAALGLLALFWSRHYDVLRALFIAGAIMLWFNPYLLLHDIGFQLSFMATLGLIMAVPHFENILASAKDKFGLREIAISTTATQVMVLPLLLYHMGEVSLVAIFVNLLVLPMVSLAMLGTFVTGLLALVSVNLGLVAAVPTTFFLAYIVEMARWWSALPLATISVPPFSPWWVLVAYLVLIGLWYVFVGGKKKTEVGQVENKKMSTSLDISFGDWEVVLEKDLQKPTDTKNGNKKTEETPIFFR